MANIKVQKDIEDKGSKYKSSKYKGSKYKGIEGYRR